MLKNKKKDIFLKRTSFGPHLDQYTFLWNGKNLRNFGSQGEHKIFLVLLKLTELNFIKEKPWYLPSFYLILREGPHSSIGRATDL